MRETQYTRILNALRKAGNKGCTVRDLLQFTNYPSARIHELEERREVEFFWDRVDSNEDGQINETERIERQDRLHNGRTIRVYVLKRVK